MILFIAVVYRARKNMCCIQYTFVSTCLSSYQQMFGLLRENVCEKGGKNRPEGCKNRNKHIQIYVQLLLSDMDNADTDNLSFHPVGMLKEQWPHHSKFSPSTALRLSPCQLAYWMNSRSNMLCLVPTFTCLARNGQNGHP